MPRRHPCACRRTARAAVLGLGTAIWPAAPLPAQGITVVLLDTALLTAPRLGESSGLAASRVRPGVYWSHNDSGDGPYLYATDSTGADLGAVRVRGAHATDWEDLAAGPCGGSRRTCLYLADIGDNDANRPYVVVYRIVEPTPPRGPADTTATVPLLDSLVLRYPDRPHDAEALAVTPSGWLLVVTKDRSGPARLFRARVPAGSRQLLLEDAGALPIAINLIRGRLVTGAAVSPNGRLLAVRTYVSLHFFALDERGQPTPLTPEAGIGIPVVEDQGEAVTFDGPDRLVLSSERGQRGRAILTRLRLTGLPR